MNNKSRIQSYKDNAGKYRIRILGENHRHVLFCTSQGYHNRVDAVAAFLSVVRLIRHESEITEDLADSISWQA